MFVKIFINFQMTIYTDDMELAGDVVASLTSFLNIEHLQSTADFPEQMDELRAILSKARHVLSVFLS